MLSSICALSRLSDRLEIMGKQESALIWRASQGGPGGGSVIPNQLVREFTAYYCLIRKPEQAREVLGSMEIVLICDLHFLLSDSHPNIVTDPLLSFRHNKYQKSENSHPTPSESDSTAIFAFPRGYFPASSLPSLL